MRPTPILLLILLLALPAFAQRVDPRHPQAVEFPVFGRMIGHIDRTTSTNGIGEQFGYVMSPVGDVNRNGLQDWIVSHNRIDSLYTFHENPVYGPFYAIELLLYKGVRGGFPLSKVASALDQRSCTRKLTSLLLETLMVMITVISSCCQDSGETRVSDIAERDSFPM